MRGIKFFKRITACALVFLLAVPFTAMSDQIQENAAVQIPEQVFRPEELEQLLAPVALYPDALLAQVLTAATYPLEVVAADRFVKANPGLKGAALLEAAKDKDWEPSVKAMLEFPDVLAMMDEQLEWTERLGNAFLAQQNDCMDAVQRLRQKAYAQGNLTTTQEQVIRVEPQTQIIVIEPASPEVVYVPVYDPAIIYGAWWYPAYPPYYFYPRRFFGISFFPGIFVGVFWEAWGTWGCNWHNRDVYVNVDRYNHFTRTSYARGDRYWSYGDRQSYQPWRYDSRHSESVRYRDSFTAAKPSTSEPLRYDKVTARAPTTALREKPRPSVSRETTVRKPIINSRENARPAIPASSVSRNNGKSQADIEKMPAKPALPVKVTKPATVTESPRASVRNQIIARPTSDNSRLREGAADRVNAKPALPVKVTKPATVTESPRASVRNQIIARPTSDNSRRKTDKENISAAVSRGRAEQARNDDSQPNRRFAPALKESNVLRAGPMRVGGR